MEVTILNEAGFNEAMYGFSLSYKDRAIPPAQWWDFKGEDFPDLFRPPNSERELRYTRTIKAAKANANRGGGHNKFRESIVVWIDIEAPRYFWSEFDTYRVGISKQSESTMHTLSKRDMIREDLHKCSEDNTGYQDILIDIFNQAKTIPSLPIHLLKGLVPESYLQRRVVCTNYQVLANMINQRKEHRLPEWRKFIEEIYKQVEHSELLPEYPYAT